MEIQHVIKGKGGLFKKGSLDNLVATWKKKKIYTSHYTQCQLKTHQSLKAHTFSSAKCKNKTIQYDLKK